MKIIQQAIMIVTYTAWALTFKPSLWLIIGINTAYIAGLKTGAGAELKELARDCLITAGYTTGVYGIYLWLGGYGLLGVVAASILVGGIVIYRRRTQYIESIRAVERMIWGKTHEEMKNDAQ